MATFFWATSLTEANSLALERAKARVTRVICWPSDISSVQRNDHLKIQFLKSRGQEILKRFAVQMAENP